MPDIRQSPEWEFYERHFATSRMQPYLVEHRGDKCLAIDLYAWNMDVSAAFWELLGYLEIALRNRIGHHHRIWTLELREKHDELLSIAGYIDAEFGEWLTSTSRIPGLLRTRPSHGR
jgi:hypothetical protein